MPLAVIPPHESGDDGAAKQKERSSISMHYDELAQRIKAKTRRTERLILRPFCDTDVDGLLELFHDENTMRMDGDRPILEKNQEFYRRIDLIKHGPLIWFFAEEEKTAAFVGYVMLQDEGEAVALGFAMTAAKQHRGYGFEMISAVVHMLREEGVKEIRIKTWEKNLPCQKLAKKLGFEKEGSIKGDHTDPLTGEIGDSYLYVLKC